MSTLTRRLVLTLPAVLLAAASLVAQDEGQDKPATPAEQYKALAKEFHEAANRFYSRSRQFSDASQKRRRRRFCEASLNCTAVGEAIRGSATCCRPAPYS